MHLPPDVAASLRDAMFEVGIDPGNTPLVVKDGITRFNNGGRDKSAWLKIFANPFTAAFGDFRLGVNGTWCFIDPETLSPQERIRIEKEITEARKAREEEAARDRAAAIKTAEELWEIAEPCASHPYLDKKKVQGLGLRVNSAGKLLVPVYSSSGNLQALQRIGPDGDKRYLKNTSPSGGRFWLVPAHETPGAPIFIAEGYATAASVMQETSAPTCVAFSASNLQAIAVELRERYPSRDLVIVGDNDEKGTGEKAALKAAHAAECRVVMVPVEGMDANDYVNAGHDLRLLLLGEPKPAKKKKWSRWSERMPTIGAPKWLIKPWFEAGTLCMVYGPSASGKSFVMLDMMLHLACGMKDWHGNRIAPGDFTVAYLAGEGRDGVYRRVQAWMQAHPEANDPNLYISEHGAILDDPDELANVIKDLKDDEVEPNIIVVDTLHRAMSGDESQAVDVGVMMRACSHLAASFSTDAAPCTVFLVHHTGHDKSRARGSSSLLAGVDFEFSVSLVMSEEPEPVDKKAPPPEPVVIGRQIAGTKAKDGKLPEPIRFEIRSETLLTDEGTPLVDVFGDEVTAGVFEIQIPDETAAANEFFPVEKTPRQPQYADVIRDVWIQSNQNWTENRVPWISTKVLRDELAKLLPAPSAQKFFHRDSKSRPGMHLERLGWWARHTMEGIDGYAIIDIYQQDRCKDAARRMGRLPW